MDSCVKEVNASSFDSLVLAEGVVAVVDFWAPRCQPCLQLSPILDEIAKAASDDAKDGSPSVKFFKIDVDFNKDFNEEVRRRYNIKAVPTAVIFENGKEVDRGLGAEAILSAIERLFERLTQSSNQAE